MLDINSFESKADRSNLVFYGQYRAADDVYVFRNVSKLDDEMNRVEININRRFGRTEQQEQGAMKPSASSSPRSSTLHCRL